MKSSTLASTAIFFAALLGTGPTYAERPLPLSDEETTDLVFMREEEKLARDTYLVLFEKWQLPVFSNIASSEQTHMDSILKLLEKYNIEDPVKGTTIGEFANEKLQELYNMLIDLGSSNRVEALKVGGIIEESDMRDIKASIGRSTHTDINSVYENLMCGSRNHLRSFVKDIEAVTGVSYVAQVLTQAEVDEIVDTPMEKCGR